MNTGGQPVIEHTNDEWRCVVVAMYEGHYLDLVRLVQQLLDRRDLAEEVVQETFIRLHELESRPKPGKELPYARSIALNQARSIMRRREVATRVMPLVPPPAIAPPVDERSLRSERIQLVREAVATLPQRQREVIELRFGNEMDEAATANQLNISRGSVKTHASRGRAALRTMLAPLVLG